MSFFGIAIKLGIKGTAKAGESAMIKNGVAKEFAEEASAAFEAVNGGLADAISVQYGEDDSGLSLTEQVAVSTLIETLGTAGLVALTGATGGAMPLT